MRTVEMVVEFPIEDSNLPMAHLLALAIAAFLEEVERQGLLVMSPASPTFECPQCGTTIFAAGQPEQKEMEK